MSILEFSNRAIPDVIKKAEVSFYHKDPLFSDLRSKNKVVRSGGSEVRFVHIISGHSDIVEINGANHTVPAEKRQTLTTATGDWGWLAKPITISQYDMLRLKTPDEKSRHIKDITMAAMLGFENSIQQQLWLGNQSDCLSVSTLNGNKTDGTSSGFGTGALEFVVPASQNGSYLGRTRTYSATAQDVWYNQSVDVTPATDMLPKLATMKRRCDSFADVGQADMSVMPFATYGSFEDEVLSYGGSAAIQYTPADIAAGKGYPPVTVVRGMRIFTNRWLDSLATESGVTHPSYLLNSDTIELWINGGMDFKFSGLKDLSDIGQKVMFGTIDLQLQPVVRNLMCNGTTF
jgi:hypothetical protein